MCWWLDAYQIVKLPVEVYYIPYVPFKVRALDVQAQLARALGGGYAPLPAPTTTAVAALTK